MYQSRLHLTNGIISVALDALSGEMLEFVRESTADNCLKNHVRRTWSLLDGLLLLGIGSDVALLLIEGVDFALQLHYGLLSARERRLKLRTRCRAQLEHHLIFFESRQDSALPSSLFLLKSLLRFFNNVVARSDPLAKIAESGREPKRYWRVPVTRQYQRLFSQPLPAVADYDSDAIKKFRTFALTLL